MKKIALALIFSAMMAGSALAATQNITVSTNVVGTCKITSGPATITLNNLDPSTGTGDAKNATLSFWCTKNTAYTVDDNSSGFLTHEADNTEKIPYSLGFAGASGAGTGASAPETLTVTATVADDAFLNNIAGKYEEVVTITIEP